MKNNLQLVNNIPALEAAELYVAKVINIINIGDICQYVVQLSDKHELVALKAETCLLAPNEGDIVLITYTNEFLDGIFILHILQRSSHAKVLDLGDEVTFKARRIKLDATSDVNIEAPEVNLSGISGSAKFTYSKLLSSWSEINSNKVLVIADTIEKIANTVNEKIVNIFKNIQGVELTQASRIRTLVTGRFFCKAKHVTMHATEDVAVDGNKINIG